MAINRVQLSSTQQHNSMSIQSFLSLTVQCLSRFISGTENTSNNEISKHTFFFIRIFFSLFIFCFWFFRYRDFLFMSQEYDLFLWHSDYFWEAVSRVGGGARYFSSFLLQFFYYPFLGAFILTCFALFLQYGTEKLFNLRGLMWTISLSPVVLLTLVTTTSNYFFFEWIDISYVYSFTFNFSFSLFLALVYNSINQTKIRIFILVCAFIITYPAFGFFTILGAFFCVLKELQKSFWWNMEVSSHQHCLPSKVKKDVNQKQREKCEFIILFILLAPSTYWFAFSDSTPNFYRLYTAGLWEESTLTQGREGTQTNLFSPFLKLLQGKILNAETESNQLMEFYISLCVIFFVLVAVSDTIRCRNMIRTSKCKIQRNKKKIKEISLLFLPLILMQCFCIWKLSFATPNFLSLLQIARALDREDWRILLEEEAKISTPINPLITVRNLALVKTNRLADDVFKRPLVPKDSLALRTITTFSMCGDRVLYEYGMTNLATRTATNNMVVKRGRTVWALKTLALCAIVDKRTQVAKRYLNRLAQTLFYHRYARNLLDYVKTQDATNTIYNTYLPPILKTKPVNFKDLEQYFSNLRKSQPTTDSLSSADSIETAYYRVVQREGLDTRTIPEAENLLATLLVSRNIPRFNELIDGYLKRKGSETIPRYIQEAILFRQYFPQLFDSKQNSWNPQGGTCFDYKIQENLSRFISYLETCKSNKEVDNRFRQDFGDTFWYFFVSTLRIHNY